MNETIVLPEMLEAGLQAFLEAKKKKLTPHDTVISVFLAMRVIEEIYTMRRSSDSLH